MYEGEELNGTAKFLRLHRQFLIGDLFLADIITEIEKNTCVRFKYVQTDIPEVDSNYTICYLPDFSQLLVKLINESMIL